MRMAFAVASSSSAISGPSFSPSNACSEPKGTLSFFGFLIWVLFCFCYCLVVEKIDQKDYKLKFYSVKVSRIL